MLGLKQRQRPQVSLQTKATHTCAPLLKFGKLNEISSSSTPIRFGRVAVPTEIFYTIVDRLRSDKHTLATCSRVCKSWFYATRAHIFREVYIHETVSTYLFYPFVRTLRTTPAVRPLIKELHLEIYTRSLSFHRAALRERAEYNLEALANVIQRLPALEVLSFTNNFWQLEDSIPVPQVSHQGLKSLTFTNGSDMEFDPRIHDIMQWFPNLKHLHMNAEYTKTPGQPLNKRLRLENIEVFSDSLSFDRLLLAISETDTIKSALSLSYQVWQTSPIPLGTFLHKAGNTMRDLSLFIQDEHLLDELSRGGCYDVFNLQSCTALETVTLEFVLLAPRSWNNHLRAVTSCLHGLIGKLNSDKLHTITLRLDVRNAKDEFAQLELHRLLSPLRKLPALREVVFVVRRSSGIVARRSISPVFASTSFGHMIRFLPFEQGEEFPAEPLHVLRLARGHLNDEHPDDPDAGVHANAALLQENYMFNGLLYVNNGALLGVQAPIQVQYLDSDSEDVDDEYEYDGGLDVHADYAEFVETDHED